MLSLFDSIKFCGELAVLFWLTAHDKHYVCLFFKSFKNQIFECYFFIVSLSACKVCRLGLTFNFLGSLALGATIQKNSFPGGVTHPEFCFRKAPLCYWANAAIALPKH